MKKISTYPIWSFNLSYTEEQRNRMIAWVHKHNYVKALYTSENYPVKPNKDFEGLYDTFVKIASSFLKFSLSENNSNLSWAFVSSAENSPAFWHNHMESSTINGVYYLKVNKDEQGIRFRQKNKEVLYKPKNNELLIFPNWLDHLPIPSKTSPRISINMEILAKESAKSIFTN